MGNFVSPINLTMAALKYIKSQTCIENNTNMAPTEEF